MAHHKPRKPAPEPMIVADTYVADPEQDAPEYALPAPPPPGPPPAGGGEGVRADGTVVPTHDPRELGVHREQPPRDVPYLPTDQHVVNKMMEMARVTKGDVLYDLGCGDGRICITAARLGARAVGVEIDLVRLRECHDNLRNTQLKHMVEFRRQSFFDVDLRPATVVALYLLPAINRRLRPKLLYELKPGTRIVANYFEIADWVPDEQIVFKHRPVMLWIVPAWVEGVWRVGLRSPGGTLRHVTVELRRTFQMLSGVVRRGSKSGGRAWAIEEGRVRGEVVKLRLRIDPGGEVLELEGRYDDGAEKNSAATMRGTIGGKSGGKNGGMPGGVWFARRIQGRGRGNG